MTTDKKRIELDAALEPQPRRAWRKPEIRVMVSGHAGFGGSVNVDGSGLLS